MSPRTLLNKLLSLLHARSTIGGLEISDSVLRYAFFDGSSWQITGLRLPPGIIEGGRVKQREEMIEALKTLKSRITTSRKKLNSVVSLSSANVYTQVFSLPMIEGDQLEKAIHLNIQMVSPGDVSQTYFGWQIVGEDEKSLKLEILSAFINKALVDEMKQILEIAGFVVYSVESRALSLVRLMRFLGRGFDFEQSYVLVSLDVNGMEFLVIRRGQLYFQYFNPWQDLEGAEHQISAIAFEAAIVRNLHQVLNFYHSHWSEPVTEILLSATTFEEQVARIITENFSLRIRPLALSADPPVSPDWFAAVGSGLRGLISPRDDRDISLLGVSAQEEFRRYQVTHFLGFWRVLMPFALALFLVVLAGGNIFLRNTRAALEIQVAQNNAQDNRNEEMNALREKVKNFNYVVDLINGATGGAEKQEMLITKAMKPFVDQGIIVKRATFHGAAQPISVNARASGESQVLALKKALDMNPEFTAVDLPITGILQDDQGVSFSISFVIVASKVE